MNIDIMRSILMKIDAIETGIIDHDIDLSEFTSEEIKTYFYELAKEGFIELCNHSDSPKELFSNNKLTLEGRNFIRVARNQIMWRNAKTTIKLAKNEPGSRIQNTNLHEMKFHFISMSN